VRLSKLVRITPETIESISTKDGRFCVPDRIKDSVESCLANDDENAITREYQRLLNEFQTYEESIAPASIDYSRELTLDAYTAYYLSRYLSIPSIALRDLAIHPSFQSVPDSISVLDMGSGTGAIVLGLLSLFNTRPLSKVRVNITALDCCTKALDRQKRLIKKAGFDSGQVHHYDEDLCDLESCMKVVTKEDPYYLIFLANCLTELKANVTIDLVKRLPSILSGNGAIIIAEAQRNYTKALIRTLAASAESLGLNVYYPCPTTGCPYSPYCWVWRDHEYTFPSIKVGGQPLQQRAKEKFPLTWLILTRKKVSIYDTFASERPDLSWGPISKETGTERAACYGGRSLEFEMDDDISSSYKRGSIVGLSSGQKVKRYYQM